MAYLVPYIPRVAQHLKQPKTACLFSFLCAKGAKGSRSPAQFDCSKTAISACARIARWPMTSVCTEICHGMKSCQQRHLICAPGVYGMFSKCSLHLVWNPCVFVCVCWSSTDLCVKQLQQRNNLTPKWYAVISCKKSTLACARYSIENYRYVCVSATQSSVSYTSAFNVSGAQAFVEIFSETQSLWLVHTLKKKLLRINESLSTLA